MRIKSPTHSIKAHMLGIFLVTTLIGCTSVTEWPDYSGFIDNYTGLSPRSDLEEFLIKTTPAMDIKNYSKFMIDPVTVYLIPNAKAYSADPGKLKFVALDFQKDIRNALSQHYDIVQTPGPGTIRLRVAITDIIDIKANTPSKGLIEAEFIDTETGETIAVVLTSNKGMRFKEWAANLPARLVAFSAEEKIYTFE